jgi:hypothetical protein
VRAIQGRQTETSNEDLGDLWNSYREPLNATSLSENPARNPIERPNIDRKNNPSLKKRVGQNMFQNEWSQTSREHQVCSLISSEFSIPFADIPATIGQWREQ